MSVAPAVLPATNLLDLTGRTAIVTGGAMGIGHAIVHRLHGAGANVVVADLDGHGAATAAGTLNDARDGSATSLHADVSSELDAARLTTLAVERYGTLDILVNNAGIYPQRPVMDMDIGLFRKVLDVNLTGLFLCCRAAAERMIARGRGGRIINITSIDALHPSMIGLAHYDASKHGAWGFTKNLAPELARHRIWVNAVAPGGIITPGLGELPREEIDAFERAIPMGRMGDPDDIARAVLFLAGEMASYITGSQLVVDGGKLLT